MRWGDRLDRWVHAKLIEEPAEFQAILADLEDKTQRHAEAISMLRGMVA